MFPVLRPKRRGFTGGTWFRPSDRARPAARCRNGVSAETPAIKRGGKGLRAGISRLFLREMRLQISKGRGGDQGAGLLHPALGQQRPDPGSGDGRAVLLLPGDQRHLHAPAGQKGHQLPVIGVGDGGKRLRPHEPPGDVQGGGKAGGEDLQIQPAADLGDAILVLDEIGGEGGGGDQIIPGGMDENIGQIRVSAGNRLLSSERMKRCSSPHWLAACSMR